MSRLDRLDLSVRDIPVAAAFFRDVLGLTLRVNEERYAELGAGLVTLMLSPDAMVPDGTAAGTILRIPVNDVAATLRRAGWRGDCAA